MNESPDREPTSTGLLREVKCVHCGRMVPFFSKAGHMLLFHAKDAK